MAALGLFAALMAFLAASPLGAQETGKTPEDGETPKGDPEKAEVPPDLDPRSILLNGGFEEGEHHPFNWHQKDFEGFDRLTCFWEARPGGKGKAVRVDTWVLCSEARPLWEKLKDLPPGERRAPPAKTEPTQKQKYQTVAASDGVHLISDFLPVKPDWEYRVQLDVFSKRTGVKVFVDGYVKYKGRDRMVYRNQKALGEEPAEKEFLGTWHRYSWPFHPTRRKDGRPLTPPPEKMRIKIWVYWPPGEVWIDNVSLWPEARREKPTPDDIEKPGEKKEKDEDGKDGAGAPERGTK